MGFFGWCGDVAGGVADVAGEAVGDVRDFVVTSFGGDSMAANAAQERAAAAKKAGLQERQDLAHENRSLQSENGYDPSSITQHENWKSLSHRHIYDTNQRSLSEQEVTAIGTAWENIGRELAAIGDELEREVPAATRGGWEGKAADSAAESVKPQVDWMRASGDVFHLTGNKMKQAGSAAGQVKAMVPEPDDHDLSQSGMALVLGGPVGAGFDAMNQMNARREAENHARETMGRVYTTTYADVDSSVPAYKRMDGKDAPPEQPPPPAVPAPPPPVAPSGPAGGDHGGGDRGGPTTYSGWPAPNHPGAPGGPGGSGGPGGGSPSTPPAGSGSAWAPTPGTSVPGAGGAGGVPGAVRPDVPGAAGGGFVAGGSGGAGGRAGGVGGRAGGAGAGRAGGGLAAGGRSGAGAVGGSGGAPSSSTAAGGSGRGAGRMPMGAMGAGGRGQGQGDEDEHERPGWLEEWDDVWLNDMPRTAPPVIGE